MITWAMIATIVGALAALVGLPISLLVINTRGIRADYHHVRDRIDLVEGQLREKLGSFVRKEDWVREQSALRQQVERQTELVSEIKGKLETSAGLATQLCGLVKALTETVQRTRAAEVRT